MLFPILTIVGGLIAASPFLVSRKPNARELFARIAPYQGFLGIGMLVLGIVWLLRWLPNLSLALTSVGGIVVLGMIVADILIGFLLGFGLLGGVLAKSETAKAKGEALLAKLTRVQVPMGAGAVALGLASFIL
jgi:hypothetical protein